MIIIALTITPQRYEFIQLPPNVFVFIFSDSLKLQGGGFEAKNQPLYCGTQTQELAYINKV